MLRFILLGASDCANRSAISSEQIKTWEKQELITYAGESKDVRKFIDSCSCVVLPSYYKEGVPRVLLEAMSMSKPIITTDVSGCRECVQAPFTKQGEILIGRNGILIPPKNPNALAYAMQILQEYSTKQLIEMGKAGRQYVINRFNMTRVIDSYHNVLSHIPKNTRLAFVSNTVFAMFHFRINVLESLRKVGYEIHIIAPLDSYTKTLQERGFQIHDVAIDSKGLNPIKDFKTIMQLKKIFKTIQPSMVFNYTIKPAIYGSLVANILHIPNIAIITGLGYVFIDGGYKRTILRMFVCKMYKIALKKTRQVWFLNSDDKAQFLDFKLVTHTQSFLLDSEGIDTQYFTPNDYHQSMQNDYSDSKDMSFLLIARMLWDKGVGEFIEAAKILLHRNTIA